MNKYFYPFFFLSVIAILSLQVGCKSSDVMQNLSAEERFELGKKAYDEEEYLEAINHFEVVKLQYPGSAVADDAQYFLGECRFKREEFLLAAEEYRALKRNFPASPLLAQAQYMIGLCYYNLAPKSTLDQEYTLRAIDEFQSFIDYYPAQDSVPSAEEKIRELNVRLAKKEYDSAELYMKLEYYKAATIYFSNVIERYHDSPYAERAYVGKIKALIQRSRYKEARQEILKFLERYPASSYIPEVKELDVKVNKELNAMIETMPQPPAAQLH